MPGPPFGTVRVFVVFGWADGALPQINVPSATTVSPSLIVSVSLIVFYKPADMVARSTACEGLCSGDVVLRAGCVPWGGGAILCS